MFKPHKQRCPPGAVVPKSEGKTFPLSFAFGMVLPRFAENGLDIHCPDQDLIVYHGSNPP